MLATAGDPANKAHRRCSEIKVYAIHAIPLVCGITIVIIIIVTITTMCIILSIIIVNIMFSDFGFHSQVLWRINGLRLSASETLSYWLVVLSEHARKGMNSFKQTKPDFC